MNKRFPSFSLHHTTSIITCDSGESFYITKIYSRFDGFKFKLIEIHTYLKRQHWMDGWMDSWMAGWMGGWMDE